VIGQEPTFNTNDWCSMNDTEEVKRSDGEKKDRAENEPEKEGTEVILINRYQPVIDLIKQSLKGEGVSEEES
jgi:hypothetical protein